MNIKVYKVVLGLIILPILLMSCDGVAGLEGVVINKQTGKRLKNVSIVMSSYYKTIETETDLNGYFLALDYYNCGIKKCDDSFSISFEIDGYEYLKLDENYMLDSSTAYLNETQRDTVVIKLIPINNKN